MKSPSETQNPQSEYTPPHRKAWERARRFLGIQAAPQGTSPPAPGYGHVVGNGAFTPPPHPHGLERDVTKSFYTLMSEERERRGASEPQGDEMAMERMQTGQPKRMVDWENPSYRIGDRVRKTSGYPFPGEVRAVITKRDGRIVYAVECTAPDCAGMLHIFAGNQLELA